MFALPRSGRGERGSSSVHLIYGQIENTEKRRGVSEWAFASGTYGIYEMSGKPIPHARLEAIPFARYTVECQTLIEKQKKATRIRQPVTSLFGLTDEEGGDGDEEEPASDNKE